MSIRHWSWIVVVVLAVGLAAGCAQKAEDKMDHAAQDVAEAWQAERDAAVAEMKAGVDAASVKIDEMRARAAELEAEGKAELAAAWNRTADTMAEARDAAAREAAKLENATAETWEGAKEAAAKAGDELERFGERAAAFAHEEKEAFVAEARKAVEEGEKDLAWAKEQLAAADEAAKDEWQKLVDELEDKHQAAVVELERIEDASADAWSDMRHGFVAAYHDLRDASKRAMAELSDM